MSDLSIRLRLRELTDYSGSLKTKADKETIVMLVEDFAEYIRELYIRLIEEAIYSRRYKGKWEPVNNKEYVKYLGVKPEKDILDIIRDALEVRKIGHIFYVRFDPRSKYPGSKLQVIKVLRAIDRGTSKFNARPIFNRIIHDLEDNLIELWKGHINLRGGALDDSSTVRHRKI